MEQTEKQVRKPDKKRWQGIIELCVLIIFISVVIVGLLPQVELFNIKARIRDKKKEVVSLNEEIDKLNKKTSRKVQETVETEIELTNLVDRVREANTKLQSAIAAHNKENELRKNAEADRMAAESICQTLSRTNHLLRIENGKVSEETEFLKQESANLQAHTNTVAVALQGLEIRVPRLTQEALDAEKRRDQLNKDIVTLGDDKKRLGAEIDEKDAELKNALSSLNTTLAEIKKEQKRLNDLKQEQAVALQAKTAVEAQLTATNKLLSEIKEELALEQANLKSAREQTDARRTEASKYTAQVEQANEKLRDLKDQIDKATAEIIELQSALKKVQTQVAEAEARLKAAKEGEMKAREAEAEARIGAAEAHKRLDEARRDELIVRKTLEQLKKDLAELERFIRATNAKAPAGATGNADADLQPQP